jgi:ABC-type transport system involved in cytochrome c biogenesis permease subunit
MLDFLFPAGGGLYIRIIIPVLFLSLSVQYLYFTLYRGLLSKKSVLGHYIFILLSFIYFFSHISWHQGRIPVGNFSEGLYFALFIITISTAFLEWFLRERSFSFIILPLESLISIVGAIIFDASASLPVAQQSFHWPIHIAFTIGSYVLFFIAFISALGYTLKYNEIKKRLRFFILNSLPSLEKIDRYMAWSSLAGLVFLSVGMFLGIFWMVALGYAGRDSLFPKIIAASVVWLNFLIYIIMRQKWNLYGRRGTYFIFSGFFLIIIAFAVGNHGF